MKYEKIWVFGDIHGCYKPLEKLLKELPIKKEHQVIFLGDYIDRGPDSKRVIENLRGLKSENPHWVFLDGNHEDMFRDFYFRQCAVYAPMCWQINGGDVTERNYGRVLSSTPKEAKYPEEHIEFLAKLEPFYENDDYIFVHAGVKPGKSVQETSRDDRLWIRDEFIDSNYDWGKKVIFGHTADATAKYNKNPFEAFEPIIMDNKIGIDTAVCPPRSNKLTVLELPSEKFHFANAE